MLTLDQPIMQRPGPLGILGHWWVIHTKSCMEKQVADELRRQGVSHYYPTVSVVRVHHRQKREFRIPFFSGYLFVAVADKGDPHELDIAYETRRVCGLIPVVNQDRLVDDLLNIERAVEVCPRLGSDVRPGMRCSVRAGHPLEGHEAWVESDGKRGAVNVRITMLGASTPLEIDPVFLKPL